VTAEGAIEAYHDQGALFSPAHAEEPSWELCIGCFWEYDEVDPTTLDGIEVRTAVWRAVDLWEKVCAEGSHAVALGGSDDHDAGQNQNPADHESPIGEPTTMVFAEELSVDAILEGIRSGRTVVRVNGIDDPMLETELSGTRMGDTVFANTATLSVVVTGGEGQILQVIKNGTVLESVTVSSDPFTHETIVEAPAEGEDRYRHQVMGGIEPQTIGSYVWLRAADGTGMPDGGTEPGESSSGCSCRVIGTSDADTGFLLAVLGFGAWCSRRRRAS
jgi:hypothetical protein